MTRRETYYTMQAVNRQDYEMGWITRDTYLHTELALACGWDAEAERRVAQARAIREERRADRRLANAILIVECRGCHGYLNIRARAFDSERGHLCASCARQAVTA